ncbi:MAG TPA: hypothetical protein VHM90_21970 [Phycisphaerae bacterium]|nr:hypothetical protein [Phycisphaerae bacterium]
MGSFQNLAGCYRAIFLIPAILSGPAVWEIGFVPSASAQSFPSSAPAVRRLPATRPLAEVEQERHDADAELERILDDPHRGKWTVLPEWVTGAWFDQRGKAWFTALPPRNAPPEEQELALRDATGGKTRVLRSNSVILIDSKRRIWQDRDDVECFDGTRTRSFAFTPPPPGGIAWR